MLTTKFTLFHVTLQCWNTPDKANLLKLWWYSEFTACLNKGMARCHNFLFSVCWTINRSKINNCNAITCSRLLLGCILNIKFQHSMICDWINAMMYHTDANFCGVQIFMDSMGFYYPQIFISLCIYNCLYATKIETPRIFLASQTMKTLNLHK